MRSWVCCGMDLAAGERLITRETEAVDSPRCSARAFRVLRRGAGSLEAELIVDKSRLLGIVEAFWHKPAEATMRTGYVGYMGEAEGGASEESVGRGSEAVGRWRKGEGEA